MKSKLAGLVLVATAAILTALVEPALAQGQGWGAVKGKIVWPGPLPEKTKHNVNQDKGHCLAKGDLYDESLMVNPENKGVKWVIVWLAPEKGAVADPVQPIHPDLKNIKEKDVVLDQPMCMFIPRAIGVREGQNLVVKNSAPILHNIKWSGEQGINDGGNVGIPAGKQYVIKDLQAQRIPLLLECSIHTWMKSRLAVFSHPYFAITDADGNFEIKNAPTGKFRLFAYQESIGWRNGAEGAKGLPIEIKGGDNNLGKLDLMKPKS